MHAHAVKRRWKRMVFAAGLFISLACTAMAHGNTTKAPVHPYDQWVNQTVATLSRLPDANALVTAAALHPLIDTPGNKTLQLLDQAARLDPSAVDIAALSLQVCEEISGCDARARARHLQALAPNNALGWLHALRTASKDKDAQQVTRVLQRMAQAGHFRTYQPSLAKRIQVGLDDVSFPPGDGIFHLSAENRRTLQIRMLISFMPIPAFRNLMLACQPDDADFTQRRSTCRQIGTELTQSYTLLANFIGVALQRWTARDTQDYQQALKMERDLDWLYGYRISYCGRAHIVTCLDTEMKATREIDAGRAIARRLGQPVTPPDSWVDKRQNRIIKRDREKFHIDFSSFTAHSDGKISSSIKPTATPIRSPQS